MLIAGTVMCWIFFDRLEEFFLVIRALQTVHATLAQAQTAIDEGKLQKSSTVRASTSSLLSLDPAKCFATIVLFEETVRFTCT